MDTYSIYDNTKKQIVDDEITISQFVDFYLTDIEKLDEYPERHRKKSALIKLNHLARVGDFCYKNFEFSKN